MSNIFKILEGTPEPKIDYLGFFGDDDGKLSIKIKVDGIEKEIPWDLKEKLEEILEKKKKIVIGKIEIKYIKKEDERNHVYLDFRIGAQEVEIGSIYESSDPFGFSFSFEFNPGTEIKIDEVYGTNLKFLKYHKEIIVVAKNIFVLTFLDRAENCQVKVDGYVGNFIGSGARNCTINTKFASTSFLSHSKNCNGKVEVCGIDCGLFSQNFRLEINLFGENLLRGAENTTLIVPAIIKEFEEYLNFFRKAYELSFVRKEIVKLLLALPFDIGG